MPPFLPEAFGPSSMRLGQCFAAEEDVLCRNDRFWVPPLYIYIHNIIDMYTLGLRKSQSHTLCSAKTHFVIIYLSLSRFMMNVLYQNVCFHILLHVYLFFFGICLTLCSWELSPGIFVCLLNILRMTFSSHLACKVSIAGFNGSQWPLWVAIQMCSNCPECKRCWFTTSAWP